MTSNHTTSALERLDHARLKAQGLTLYGRSSIRFQSRKEPSLEPVYKEIIEGTFIDRPNRFVCHVLVHGKAETCHMPNPGRMREFLFPGVTLYLTPNRPGLRTAYRVVGVKKGEDIFYLDTTKANDVASYLVQHRKIPGWENYFLAGREVTMGDSRFDLLLGDADTGETFPVEVKSCSLSGERGAMFPDAPTERGEKHMAHLVTMAENGEHAGLLVLVHYRKAQWFLPNFHTDLPFGEWFRKGMDVLDWKAAGLSWTEDFHMPESVRLIGSSAKALDEEMGNAGDYMIVLHLEEDRDIPTGSLGTLYYRKGYYVIIGKDTTCTPDRRRETWTSAWPITGRSGRRSTGTWTTSGRNARSWRPFPSVQRRTWNTGWQAGCRILRTGL